LTSWRTGSLGSGTFLITFTRSTFFRSLCAERVYRGLGPAIEILLGERARSANDDGG
jgi:hypothetical protein